MADELAQAADLTQPTEIAQNASEGGKTPDTEIVAGMRAEMMKERQLRQEMEQRFADPVEVFNAAKRLGMTDAEATAEAEAPPPQPQKATIAKPELTLEQMEARLENRMNARDAARSDYDKTVNANPELLTDPLLNRAFQSFVQQDNMRWSDAAAKVLSLREQTTPTPVQSPSMAPAKAAASTAQGTGTSTSQAAEISDIHTRMMSKDRSTQDRAFMEEMIAGRL